ncbi:MAG: GNAT family N-acetyltransferase [Patescibacteria group bacterium]
MKIRLLKKKDIKTASIIAGMNYSKKEEKLAKIELKEMFTKGPFRPVFYVAEEKGKVIGFAGYAQAWMEYSVYQIFWVNVTPNEKGKGIGKVLVSKVIAEIKKKKNADLILISADENAKNHEYYKKHFGFKTLELFGKKPYHLMSLTV